MISEEYEKLYPDTDYDLIIVVYGCDTIERYKTEILKCQETWVKDAKMFSNIKVLFFLGEEVVLEGDDYIHLKDVKNDYISASYKQWHGIKYVYENYNPKFIMIIGTDTFVNIPKLMFKLFEYDYTKKLYIGGYAGNSIPIINGNEFYYHPGGGGIILSNSCLPYICSYLKDVNKFMEKWMKFCDDSINGDIGIIGDRTGKCKEYYPACDVCLAYMIFLAGKEIETIRLDNNFYSCNYLGYNCHGLPDKGVKKGEDIITCHYMRPIDFDNFHKLLKDNNYYI